jgi:hypothetical protein
MPQQMTVSQIRSKGDLYNYYGMDSRTVRNWLRDLGYNFTIIKTKTIPPAEVKKIVNLLGEK